MKAKYIIFLFSILFACASYAAEPNIIRNDVPRFIFIDDLYERFSSPLYYKFDTATGQLYENEMTSDLTQTSFVHIIGVPVPIDNVYPGRFQLSFQRNGKYFIFILDTMTGNVWASKMGKERGFKPIPNKEEN